jgi:hypothetical protein
VKSRGETQVGRPISEGKKGHLGFLATHVTIKELLGHASIASSERYARVSNQKVKQEYLRSMQKILHQSKV